MATSFQFERDRAYHDLVDLIMGGDLDPNEPLSERKIAESLGIGRTPVREAMRDLARDGVLDVLPARGTYVHRLSAEDVREIYEVRHGIEGLAASLAAERGATQQLSAYGPIFRDIIEHPDAHDTVETYETGAQFHVEIFRAARNRQLLNLYRPLRLRFQLALALPRYFDPSRVYESVPEHLSILEVIEAGDPQEAERLMCEHLTRGAEARSRLFNDVVGSDRHGVVVAGEGPQT